MNVLKPHVSLNVSNIEASVAFYEKVFGVNVTKRRPGYAKFDLQQPLLNLSMVEAPRTGLNASHFGIQVAGVEDVAAAWARFKHAGVKTKTEQNTSCCYALQDKVWVEDPDGNEWEVFVVKGDTDQMSCDPTTGSCVPLRSAEPNADLPTLSTPGEPKDGGGCCGPEANAETKPKAAGGCRG